MTLAITMMKYSNSHIFADLSGKIDQKTDFYMFSKVSNDNYLKIHNLSSSLSLITVMACPSQINIQKILISKHTLILIL